MLKLFKELKRRKMFRTLVAYGTFAFVLIQVCSIVFPALLLPDWANRFVVILVIIGFPVTVFFAWVYDITPEGIHKTPSASKSNEDDKKSRKVVLPITGFLTIIGGIFWIWYSLGNVSSGSDLDLQLGIKKTIAVFPFDNLSGKKEDDHLCSAISLHIRNVLNKIGKLNVKARRFTLNNNPKDLDLDYYIDGYIDAPLSGAGGSRNIVVDIVNAKSETDLWSGQFKYNDKEILAIQDTIVKSILTELGIAPIGNDITSSTDVYKSQENFKLIGEGILNFDTKNYLAATKAFDSVLESDPENIVALYHKANSFVKLDNFQEAMTIYKNILGQSIDINPIQFSMPIPKRKGVHPILCENIELIEDKDLAIILLKGDKLCRLMCYNTVSMEEVCNVPIDDQFVSKPVIINNTAYLSSSRLKEEEVGEPTLYAYNISNGREIFIREFPRDNPSQAVLINILEEYSNISDNTSTMLLSFDKIGLSGESQKEVELIETANGSKLWKSKVQAGWGFSPEVMLIRAGNTELLLLKLEKDIVALNNKTGTEVWHENFSGSVLAAWNQKILKINPNEKYVALWDPISRKEVWKTQDEREYVYGYKMGDISYSFAEFRRRMSRDVVLLNFTNGDLVAVNYDGGFLNWNRERWTVNIGYAEKIWLPENMSNHVFCLTGDDSLFTINMDSGKIIKRLAIDEHNYNVYYDDSKNTMVLNNSEFFIGIDPINGDQLWKIKDNGVDKVGLVGNSILAAKTVLEDSLLLINAYNRDNGNLIWSESIDVSASLDNLPAISPMCGTANCAFCNDFNFYLKQYSDTSLFLVLHDEIIKMGALQDRGAVIRQKDVRLQIARTYEKRGELKPAINEYTLLLTQDQMNQYAHWELANIYQRKNKVNDAAKSLINYYNLILPETSEGTLTIQKLKDLSLLKWNKNISRDRSDDARMDVDREKIFLFINNNVESYSIQSSALIWKSSFGDENTRVVFADVKNEKYIYFIKKDVPDAKTFYLREMLTNKRLDFDAYEKASKYGLAAVNKRDAKISWDVPLEIPGESVVSWMGVKSNKIFIQSTVKNKMSVSVYDIVGGNLLWKISRDISSLCTSYSLTPALYEDFLLLPLCVVIEYINVENGNTEGKYSDKDFEQILSFNENSIQNNTMKFFIDEFENEYVEVDLEKNVKISSGVLDLDNPEQGMWLNDIFIDVSSSGSVAAYKLPPNTGGEAVGLWSKNYNTSLSLVGANEQYISLLDLDSERIIVVDARLGTNLQSKPLLWPGKNVEMTDYYYIVQSSNKLYVVPM